jgi:glutamate dehydrogenase
VARVGFDARGHDGRALLNVLETYPRDELFQVGDDALTGTALGILHLQHRPRVAVFVRRDAFDRFVGCLIYLPRDRYTTDLRLRIQGILERAFAGRVTAHFAQVGDLPLARLQIYLQTTPGQIPAGALAGLQEAIVTACRTWADGLLQALTAVYGDERGRRLYRRYALAFPPGYRDRFSEEQAVGDIACCEETLTRADVSMTLYRPIGAENDEVRFKIFHPDAPIVLSQVLPLLEHLGLQVIDEDPHAVRVAGEGARTVMIHDFGLRMTSGRAIELASVRDHFQETFRRVWQGAVESDGFNALVLAAGLTWRQVVILRACCKMLRQAGIAFSQAYMERTLAAHPGISRLLVDLFETMFDPEAGNGRAAAADAIRAALAKALDGVASADEDRILRRFLNLVESTLRTNYFQTGPDGTPKPYLALKLDSRRLDDLPAPRPMVEVFVYSPEVEGVHLRGGKVARGGIRWSDRREDFRTEILGLMKAQTVKNAVIVPVGAKGGFVVKRRTDPLDREAALAAGIACYRTFIRGLLDLTDTLAGGRISVPAGVVRRDDDDPYLVVAADKGTATFSDIANAIAAEYGFWLGDAFASGGSQGYDHKKIAITARGAWESVKRHFRELGIDVQASDFTVVGVGDMSGDVFGNAMLLSPHIRLVAAFDHRHIFVDPEPDAARSLDERARLFLLQRSSWADYDEAVLSPGGRVFERGAKMVPLSPEIRARFNLAAERMTPSDLIRRLITAEVDLLWFGGIGTFVKAADETDAEVGDRSNDAVRVNGRDLRCRVIGEGANLGLTQLGRIEFALRGGRLNSDFIDNSAGVDCSDHEVNIKILLDAAVADGDLTLKQRNKLLTAMTDEVAALVLRDNYQQTQAISQIEAEGFAVLDSQARLIRLLERQGRLDRAVEFLPDEDALAERSAAKQGLSRPEIAVLFSYCKIWLHAEVLASDLPDDRHLAADVERYFPSAIRRRLPARIAGHPLRRELAATVLTNSLINRVGGTFVSDIIERTGLPPAEIARAYIIARDVFRARDLWQAIEAEDSVMPAAAQVTLRRDVRRLIERATLWFLANGGRPLDIAAAVAEFAGVVAGLADDVEALLPAAVSDRIQFRTGRYRRQGVPEGLARRIAFLIVLPSVLDIVRLAAARGEAPDAVARLYFQLGETLGFGWLRYQAEKLAVDSHWQKLAAAAVIDELYAHQRNIARRVLEFPAAAAGDAIAAWSGAHAAAVERTRALIAELNAVAAVDLSMLTVASRQLRTLAED